MMNAEKRKKIKDAGYEVTDAATWLGLSEAQKETVAAMTETEALLRDPSAKRYARFSDILSEVKKEG